MVFEHPFGQCASNDLVSRELEAFSVERSSGPLASFSPARHAHVRGGRGLAVRGLAVLLAALLSAIRHLARFRLYGHKFL